MKIAELFQEYSRIILINIYFMEENTIKNILNNEIEVREQ